jgi:peptidoglycan/LPS O-acetylase OafA/YrhL
VATKGFLIGDPVVVPFGVEITTGAIITTVFASVLLLLALAASVITLEGIPGVCKLRVNTAWEPFKAFSLHQNLLSLCELSIPPKRMVTSALEGMRVLSMQWVMIGHTFLFFKGNADNALAVEGVEMKRWTMQTIDNGTYSVDTFFALSGFLLAYVSLGKLHGMRQKQLAKEEAAPSVLRHAGTIGMMVVHRWLRLVPSLGMVMLMNAQLLSHVGDGPLWAEVDAGFASNCRDYWWSNILFVNNFHPADLSRECVAQSWYLANDMQFFIFTMPFLFAFVFWEPFRSRLWARCGVLGVIVMTSIAVTMGHIHKYNLSSTQVGTNPLDPDGMQSNNMYVQPQYRIGAYAVGVLAGVWFYWWMNERQLTTEHVAPLVPSADVDSEQKEAESAADLEQGSGYKQLPEPAAPDEIEAGTEVTCLCTARSAIAWIGLLFCLAIMAAILLALNQFDNDGVTFSSAENLLYGGVGRPAWAVAVTGVILGCAMGALPLVNQMLSMNIFVPLSKLTYGCYVLHISVLAVVFDGGRSLKHWTDEFAIFLYLGTLFFTYILASLLFVLVDMPVARLESRYLGRL